MGQCALANRAALLTCITNGGGLGPGHSALAVDSYVFTFEQVAGAWLVPNSSGWLTMKTRLYLEKNRHRPVVIQELSTGLTNASAIRNFIATSAGADTDYGSSGLCSHLAAQALSAGLPVTIDPLGLNSPYRIYRHLKFSGCVSKSYYTFPDRDDYTPANGRKLLLYNLYSPEWKTHQTCPNILKW